jgi:hypothetical protein
MVLEGKEKLSLGNFGPFFFPFYRKYLITMYRALRGPPLSIPQRIFGPRLSTEKGERLLKVVRV